MNRAQIAVLGLTVAAFAGAYVMFANGGPPSAPQVIKVTQKVETDDVLVAAHDLQMGSKLTEADFKWQEWPKAGLAPWMIKKTDGPNAADDIKGGIARADFPQGDPLRRDKIITGANSGFMSAILPSGMRAIAINIDQQGSTTAGGFILPNDRVDVIQIYRDDEASKARGTEVLVPRTILTNVRVLAIGQNVQEKNGERVVVGSNATLELDPQQVELIVLAQRAGNGNLHLALRSLLDSKGKTDSNVAEYKDDNGLTIVRFGAAQQAVR
jgi:pilus assembly protein CpaB